MMKKWILRFLYVVLVMGPVAAIADYTATTGTGSTVFAFVCSSTKICPATVLMDSTNVEKATAGNPLRVDPTGTTTQPVSAASLPLPTGAATAANQTAEIAAINGPVPACAAAPCVTTIGNTGEMANVGGVDTKAIKCGSSAVYDASTNGSTQLVALSGATSVYVCGYTIMAGGTVNVKLITGTGAACVTGTASITPAYQLTAQAGVADGANEYRGLKGAASSALCLNTSAGVAVQAIVYYTQF